MNVTWVWLFRVSVTQPVRGRDGSGPVGGRPDTAEPALSGTGTELATTILMTTPIRCRTVLTHRIHHRRRQIIHRSCRAIVMNGEKSSHIAIRS
jgi:hypothetical protein